jgi:hypothetical protein
MKCNLSFIFVSHGNVFILENYRMRLPKYHISLCIPHRYVLEMVDHSIVIGVLTRTTNEMQLIAYIHVTRDVLLEAKLSHYMI